MGLSAINSHPSPVARPHTVPECGLHTRHTLNTVFYQLELLEIKMNHQLRIQGTILHDKEDYQGNSVWEKERINFLSIGKNVAVSRRIVPCRNPGLNRGPLDLQSNALPTELFRLTSTKRTNVIHLVVFVLIIHPETGYKRSKCPTPQL